MVEIEPATFWLNSPEIERGELKTEEIETEVFFFPAAGHAEKEGAFTNTQRLLQWREKAVDPPGDCRSESWFIHQLALRLMQKRKHRRPGRRTVARAGLVVSGDDRRRAGNGSRAGGNQRMENRRTANANRRRRDVLDRVRIRPRWQPCITARSSINIKN